jgi:hypothetical protein
MAVALVINGIPDIQQSEGEGLESLRILLQDRQSAGCTITPSERVAFGIEYRVEHPSHGIELIYLTYYQDPADDPDEA